MTNLADMPTQTIGDIIGRINSLDAGQIDTIVDYQRKHGVKFGEAAVALRLARPEDVAWALSVQFNYPYEGRDPQTVSPELVVATRPFEPAAEFFRDIRSRMLATVFSPRQPRRLALAVCSVDPGDGKTFFAINLAAAFSQLPGRTLLIDADMRTSRMQAIFGTSAPFGLSSTLAGRAEVDVLRPVGALPNLYMLPVGVTPPNPLELVQGQPFDLLMQRLLSQFDHVIVDTPAASQGADARVIAEKCGGALTIARRGVSAVTPLKTLVDNLQKSCEVFSGVLFNDHRHR
ncbi:polysaccharide biosynthesis tyrosine autokinase [uncultured Aquabacterium sp.]|uniref:polysaccharide biosynthesis tyrosine autokinase n=1 Tax=Aquabacterium sp. TaxID=1872578 RepID=UPI0025F520FE|nr:polysaccharide biosynthesis tyrosine autokinase [uncultured Aquabacterium sp.]